MCILSMQIILHKEICLRPCDLSPFLTFDKDVVMRNTIPLSELYAKKKHSISIVTKSSCPLALVFERQ